MHGVVFVKSYFLMLIGFACFGLLLQLVAILLKRIEATLEALLRSENQNSLDESTETKP